LELLQKDPSTLKHYTWVAKQKLKHWEFQQNLKLFVHLQ
jgi:hypothetical protein